MKLNNFRVDLTDISAKKEALAMKRHHMMSDAWSKRKVAIASLL